MPGCSTTQLPGDDMPGYADPGFDTLALRAGRRRPDHRRARRPST